MILLDALYINDGGGKVLLDYLISEFEKLDEKIYYLLDQRVEGKIQPVKKDNVILYSAPSFIKRHQFYQKNKSKFQSIFCFGNLPPNIKTEARVYTYFHQALFFKIDKDLPIVKKIMYFLKIQILNTIKKNTNFWLVQTDLVKEQLIKKFRIKEKEVLVMPFYPPLPFPTNVIRKPHTYLYVSNATPHKNHQILIDAFSEFYLESKVGELFLTINEDYPEILTYIENMQQKGIPITNLGFMNRAQLAEVYKKSEFLIFPSLAESFGLGLVEAIDAGCKIIGADLPYTKVVCNASLLFNPTDKASIIRAFFLSLEPNLKASKSLVKNHINELKNLLLNYGDTK